MDDVRGFSDAARRPSWPVLAGIVVLHVALLYGLIQAFAPDLVARTLGNPMATFDVDLPPPQPSPTPEESKAPCPPED